MVCPYAKNIRGLVVYCEAARKKVSSLRYPCKGDYKKCPIYRRAQRAARRAAEREKPKPVPPVPEEPSREEAPVPAPEKPAVPAAPPAPQPGGRGEPVAPPQPQVVVAAGEAMVEQAVEAQEPGAGEAVELSVGSGKAACDSLIAAELLISAQYLRARSGAIGDLVREVVGEDVGGGAVVFFTGDIRGAGRIRGIAYAGRITSFYFEKAGKRYCGVEAWRNALAEEGRAVIRVYRVDLDRLPGNVARVIREEIG